MRIRRWSGSFPVAVLIIFKGVKGPKGIKVVRLEEFGPLTNPVADIAHLLLDKLKGDKDGQWKKKRPILLRLISNRQ